MKSNTSIHQPSKRILIVEDDRGTAEMVSTFFEMLGYSFILSPTAAGLKQLISKFSPDLILLDYLLPAANGAETCKQIKNDPLTSQLPVVIYSAHPKAEQDSFAAHCDAFLAKPFDIDVLAETIAKSLQKPKNQKTRRQN